MVLSAILYIQVLSLKNYLWQPESPRENPTVSIVCHLSGDLMHILLSQSSSGCWSAACGGRPCNDTADDQLPLSAFQPFPHHFSLFYTKLLTLAAGCQGASIHLKCSLKNLPQHRSSCWHNSHSSSPYPQCLKYKWKSLIVKKKATKQIIKFCLFMGWQ